MRTSAPPARPNVTMAAAVCAAIATTRWSSALRIAVPDGGSASTSSALARATPSMPPTRSVCDGATAVTTPTAGRAMSHRRRISPKPRMPISSTRTSVSSGAPRTVTGRPCSLLKLRSLATTRLPGATAARMRSLVLVLPTLPVMPTTVAASRLRPHRGEVHQRGAGVSDGHRRDRRRHRPGRQRRRGAGGHRGADELVAVAGRDDRHEQLTRTQRAGVEGGPVELDVGAFEHPAGGRGDVGCPKPHGAERYRCLDGCRPDPPRRAVRRAVCGARRQLCDRHPRARGDRHVALPGHADRHLDRRRLGPGRRCQPGPRRRPGRAPAEARPGGLVDRPVGGPHGRRRARRAHGRVAVAARPDG